ncbi:MAG: hypothetical protein PHI12_11170 [Dehalococcoidales bacterium]|nr:hypothetical protein [Candidatus Thermoplasmatota archaeon]MDD5511349.1 hypothetical protein [Dehalococcoidales bacterium]
MTDTKLETIKNIIHDRVLSIPDVSSVYYDEEEQVVIITVDSEDDEPRIRAMLPANLGGYRLEFKVMKTPVLFSRTMEYRPLVGGVSIGHHLTSAGTNAVLCYDRKTGAPLVLSNVHVLTPILSTGSFGARGDPISQPGVLDTDGVVRKAGELLRWVQPVNGQMYADAAIANPVVEVSDLILADDDDYWQVKGVAKAERGMKVKKSGRTTGTTFGEIVATDMDTKAADWQGNTIWQLLNQIRVDISIEGGDSGSLLLTDDNKAVGLIWGGNQNLGIASPIGYVMSALDIGITSQEEQPPEEIPEQPPVEQNWYLWGAIGGLGVAAFLIPVVKNIRF